MFLDNTTKPWVEYYHSPVCQSVRERIISAFTDLQFDEGPHVYTLNGVEIPSVSSVVERFVPPFEAEKIAYNCWKNGFDNPNSKYYQMSVEEIVQSWEDNAFAAAYAGTIAHAFAESCFYYMVGEYDLIRPEHKDRLVDGKLVAREGFEIAITKFWQDMPKEYVPILSEQKVYGSLGNDEPKYAGTLDLLVQALLPQGERLVMFDWKTNADLYKNFRGKKMLNGLEFLLDTPKNHYEVQQSLYENALNEIDLRVAGKRLVWIKESGEYERIPMVERIMQILKERI